MATAQSNPRSSGFSLLELVIVVVVLAVIAGIAITRVGAAAQNSRIAAIAADLRILNNAAEVYTAEHEGRGPAIAPDGTIDTDPVALAARLVGSSSASGKTGSGAGYPLGPYLASIPRNPMNGLDTVRVDGPAAGTKNMGWRYDSATGTFRADDSAASATIQADDMVTRVNQLDGRSVGATAEDPADVSVGAGGR